jgi:outer membrane receptor protein involved in Fe transport
MRSPRLWRLAAAYRLPFTVLVLSLAVARASSAATLAGRVTDPDGRGVPSMWRVPLEEDLTYSSPRLGAFVGLTSRSRVLDLEPNYGGFGGLFLTPGYTVVNAGVTVPIAKGLQIYARGLNLADRAYEETLGYPALRRTGIVGVRIAAGR